MMKSFFLKSTLYSLLILFSYMNPSIAFAKGCSIVDMYDTPEQVNDSCLDNLAPSEFSQLVSLISESEINNHILDYKSDIQKNNYSHLISKTIKLYEKTKNLEYSNALLKLLETQKLIDLQNYFDDDCTPLNNEIIKPAMGEAMLYMHSLPNNQFLVLLVTTDNLHVSFSKTSDILANVVALKKILFNLPDNPLFSNFKHRGEPEKKNDPLYKIIRQHATLLYDLLISPFSSKLANLGIRHLVVIPDSTTGIFPVEVLLDKIDDKYIIDKEYAISYSPNLSKIQKNTNNSKELLFISPELPNDKESSLNQDLELIKKILPVSNVQGKKATKNGLFNAITNRPTSILYIASHARFEKNFEDSHIELYAKEPLSVRDFERMTSSLSARAEPPDLIVLSACETAQSDGGELDASLGLAGVAARSGANTVIASLWETRSPEVLLGSDIKQKDSFFHILFNNNLTKAKALQESKRRLKKSRSMYEWASFVLIGDWGNY